MDEIVLLANDVDDIRYALGACLTLLQAQDLAESQRNLNATRPSGLTLEIERVKQRVDNYFAQHILDQYDTAEPEYDPADAESISGDPEASGDLAEAPELLSDAPLGKTRVKRQAGRRLTASEAKNERIS